MAVKTLNPNGATYGRVKLSKVLASTSATTLTAAYVAETDWVDTASYEVMTCIPTYVKGDETTVEVKFQWSPDGGTTVLPVTVIETPSSGVSAWVTHVLQLTPADWAATDYPNADIDSRSRPLVRAAWKATGGTPTGTIAIRWLGGWKQGYSR